MRPSAAVIADANPLLIETYRAVRDKPELVHRRLSKMEWSEEGYYRVREEGIASPNKYELAARFVFLNANCFNGLFRTNRHGWFNVPYGGERAGRLPSKEKLVAASSLLRTADIECEDFETLLRRIVRRGDFVYLDPPFAVGNSRVFHQYRYDDFGTADVGRLIDLLQWIDGRGARFLLSYAASPEASRLAEGWDVSRVSRLGNIAGFRDRRRKHEEVLIFNG